MNEYKIRRYRNEDLESLIGMWKAEYGNGPAKKRALFFKWRVEQNPYSKTQDDYYVIDRNGIVVGYQGIMPYQFYIAEKDYDGFIYCDTLITPEHRGKRLTEKLINEMATENKFLSIAVWFNAISSKIFQKCDWDSVDSVYPYIRIYNVNQFIQTKSNLFNIIACKIINSGLAFLYRIINVFLKERKTVIEVDTFDERVEKLFHSVKNYFEFITYRTKDVLNWRYSQKPFSSYRKLICIEGNEFLGYIVFRTKRFKEGQKIATILDFLCSPDRTDVFIALMKKSIREIEKSNPDYIEILSTNQTYTRELVKLGFLRAGEKKGALKIKHYENFIENSDLKNISSWFFTYGEGDGDFWNDS